ncbi:MAG: hypothetical protein KGL53_00030 [Elusimicrobia bacterium]|nr:hypothetical protein [Elusimicrobiota bacterium]
MDAAPDSWFQQLSIEFSDGTVEVLHIERSTTGTHVARPREKTKEWARLAFNKCSCCPLPESVRNCPAAMSLQATMGKLRRRSSVERVRATAVDGEGRAQTVESDLQGVGGTLVRFAVFETACPVGYRLKPYSGGLPAFSDSMTLMRALTRRILERHGGSVEAAQQELSETLGPLQEVFVRLIERIRSERPEEPPPVPEGQRAPIYDAVPNSIVQADAVAKRFAMKADALCAELGAELGWGRGAGPPA